MKLTLRDCQVDAPDGRLLLSVPHLDLPSGMALGIRGPSGAGKTTLLFALAGLLDRVQGQIYWNDRDILALAKTDRTAFRAAHIGMIFQDFLLFDELDALGNAAVSAMFAPRSARSGIRNRAKNRLAHLGLPWNTQDVSCLSGGERQRVAVARALANDAQVLLADEPTASLDRAAADVLIDQLMGQVRTSGKTLIVVSHDPMLIARMDRVIDLVDGFTSSAQQVRIA